MRFDEIARKSHSSTLAPSWHGYSYVHVRTPTPMAHTTDFLDTLLTPVPPAGPGTLWTLSHETEGVVSVNVGLHPHGYELRLLLNYRFLRSRVHHSLADVLADAADTRHRFEVLGFEEIEATTIH